MEDDQKTGWQSISFPSTNDDQALIEIVVLGGREEVGLLDTIPFERVASLLTNVAQMLGNTLEKVSPTKASVELGVEFGLKEGQLVALIARGSGKANLKINLEWDRSKASTDSTAKT